MLISENSKTGVSLNFGLSTCRPTKWCLGHCYARQRSAAEAAEFGMGSTPNYAPITMKRAQLSYEANTTEAAHRKPESLADELAFKLFSKGLNNIRFCGCGDLTEPTARLAVELARLGIRVWGFTRKSEMVKLMIDLGGRDLPVFFTGSTDCTTRSKDINSLRRWCSKLNQDEQCLATAVSPGGWPPKLVGLRIVFGYHSMNLKTVIGHELECPSTAGLDVHCQECKRCMYITD